MECPSLFIHGDTHYQEADLVDHAANLGGVLVIDGLLKLTQPKSPDSTFLAFRFAD